jgi:hypothetical protein
MERRLEAIAAKTGRPVPRGLPHAIVFFTSGEIVGALVPGYVPYATKAGVWDRGMRELKSLLDTYWRPYVRGAVTFDEAVASILAASR